MSRGVTTQQLLKDIGIEYSELKHSHIINVGIAYLETMADVHEYTYLKYRALLDNKRELIDGYNKKEAKIIDRAAGYYKIVRTLRDTYMKAILSGGPKAEEDERKKCSENMLHFFTQWLWLHEPRQTSYKQSNGEGLSTLLPFILYPAQKRVVETINDCFENRQDFIVGKSREAGISWAACGWGLWKWLFTPGFRLGLGSETEEKVDSTGSSNSLMGKIRHMIYHLPDFLRPSGYRKKGEKSGRENRFDTFKKLLNNDNDASILGEAGKNIGRGGRYSAFFIDESQALQQPELANSALESATPCRGDIGTPDGMNHFGRKWFSHSIVNIQIMWYEDPRKTRCWRGNKPDPKSFWRKHVVEKAKDDPAKIAQEYDLDFQASVTDLCIESKWIMAAVDADIPYCDNPQSTAGFDIAGSGSDHAVYIQKVGNRIKLPKEYGSDDVIENILCAHTDAVVDRSESICYDAVTIGESMYGTILRLNEDIPYVLIPIKGQEACGDSIIYPEAQPANKLYYNKRAMVWCNLRRLFKNTYRYVTGLDTSYDAEELISIPNSPKLIEQLAYPKLLTKNGKKIIESKEDMKHRGLLSPDYADACAYACSETTSSAGGERRAVSSFKANAAMFKHINVDYNGVGWEYYITVYHNSRNETAALLSRWHPFKKKLEIIDEFSEYLCEPKQIKLYFSNRVSERFLEKARWIGQNSIYREIIKKDGFSEVYRHFRKDGITLKFNLLDDVLGSIMTLNSLFGNGVAVINYDCKDLAAQLTSLDIGSNKIDDRYTHVHALLLLAGQLKEKKKREIQSITDRGYNKKESMGEKALKKLKVI